MAVTNSIFIDDLEIPKSNHPNIKKLKNACNDHTDHGNKVWNSSLVLIDAIKTKKSKSRVNEAGNYTKPGMRKRLFNKIKAGGKGGNPGQWSARKAQMLAKQYKAAGGGYK